MPSANPNKLEKQASTESVEPIRQIIIAVEHKIRNLEKRKGKLESYRDIVKNGGELNVDQKTAVAKYDEVAQTLDSTRDLHKQINQISNDAAKQQKKIARKEAAERMQQDIAKVREVLLIQDTLMNLAAQGVREDLLNGTNGAVKLSEEDLKGLNELIKEVAMKHERQENEPTFVQQAQKVAEHFVLIVDGKQREVAGTTYSRLKEVFTSITNSGYFERVHKVEAPVEELQATSALSEIQISNTHAPEQINEEFHSNDRYIPPPPQSELVPMPAFPVQVTIPVVSGAAPVPTPIPVVAQQIPQIPQGVDASYYTNASFVPPQVQQQQQSQPPQQQGSAPAPRINDVIGPAPNFFFLQDSELDAPEVAASQAPPVVSHIPPSATVVAAPVTLNAPIPTQTFTNPAFNGPPVMPQVMYQHQPPQEMSHMSSFGNANPPPPIPMPQTHQNMQFNKQNSGGFQQSQVFEQMSQQESHLSQKDELHENLDHSGSDSKLGDVDAGQNHSSEWGQMSDGATDWSQVDPSQSNQDSQFQSSQQWGDQQRSGFRGRGRGRGNSNYNRGRSYQQNGSYYNRNSNDGNYQNGYQRNNWSNNGDGNNGGGYNSGFKRSTNNQSRGGPRNDRAGMDRGGRGGGGQFRGNQRGTNRTNYAPRGKPVPQN